MFTVFLKETSTEPLLQVGSKALHLANIFYEGVTIPDGFVLKANALNQFMKDSNLHNEMSHEQFAAAFQNAPIPQQIAQEILNAFQQLKTVTGDANLTVAVRSSSSAEDLQDASFAGQYDTILNVRDEQQLLDAVKQCWASVFSEHARDYATQRNISLADFPMGILIQQMVYPDVAGVIFSKNPITESNDEIIINASYGLGEAIVSGIVTPDTFIVNKQTKAIEKDLGLKEVKILPVDNTIIEVATTAEECAMYCLDDASILALEEVTAKLEAFYAFPVDVEFAMKDGKPYVLQSRPITA